MIGRFVCALALALALPAWAEAPSTALRPKARVAQSVQVPDAAPQWQGARPHVRVRLAQFAEDARLGDGVAYGVMDLNSGAIVEARHLEAQLPPASVTKVFTTLYALAHLPRQHRFQTRLHAFGAITNGTLEGDLALIGGGDPVLDSDVLAGFADTLAERGIRRISGRLLVWGGALPYVEELSEPQMDHLGYNPALSGLNLNFNRVRMRWTRVGSGYRFAFIAESARNAPEVELFSAQAVGRAAPVILPDGPDRWSLAASALGSGGSRWMPVRQPALYAGATLRALAAERGITLPRPEQVQDRPEGYPLAIHRSAVPSDILRDMLYYSTNLTAEVMGLQASREAEGGPVAPAQSAARMRDWIADQYGVSVDLRDHSGLDDRNRLSVDALLRVLSVPEVQLRLRPVLKSIDVVDQPDYPGNTFAKTGTLNFVSALAGYVDGAFGTPQAFAILSADLDRRAQGIASGQEVPEGALAWNTRAKALQDAFLRRWRLRSGTP